MTEQMTPNVIHYRSYTIVYTDYKKPWHIKHGIWSFATVDEAKRFIDGWIEQLDRPTVPRAGSRQKSQTIADN